MECTPTDNLSCGKWRPKTGITGQRRDAQTRRAAGVVSSAVVRCSGHALQGQSQTRAAASRQLGLCLGLGSGVRGRGRGWRCDAMPGERRPKIARDWHAGACRSVVPGRKLYLLKQDKWRAGGGASESAPSSLLRLRLRLRLRLQTDTCMHRRRHASSLLPCPGLSCPPALAALHRPCVAIKRRRSGSTPGEGRGAESDAVCGGRPVLAPFPPGRHLSPPYHTPSMSAACHAV